MAGERLLGYFVPIQHAQVAARLAAIGRVRLTKIRRCVKAGGPGRTSSRNQTVMSGKILVGFIDSTELSFGPRSLRFGQLVSGAKLVRPLLTPESAVRHGQRASVVGRHAEGCLRQGCCQRENERLRSTSAMHKRS